MIDCSEKRNSAPCNFARRIHPDEEEVSELTGNAAHAARQLFLWVTAIRRCQEIMPHFLVSSAYETPWWEAVRACDDVMPGVELWEPNETDYDSDAIDPERYISPEVLRSRLKRPRPLLVAVARDLPSEPKRAVVQRLKESLPGAFTHTCSYPPLSTSHSFRSEQKLSVPMLGEPI